MQTYHSVHWLHSIADSVSINPSAALASLWFIHHHHPLLIIARTSNEIESWFSFSSASSSASPPQYNPSKQATVHCAITRLTRVVFTAAQTLSSSSSMPKSSLYSRRRRRRYSVNWLTDWLWLQSINWMSVSPQCRLCTRTALLHNPPSPSPKDEAGWAARAMIWTYRSAVQLSPSLCIRSKHRWLAPTPERHTEDVIY